MSDVATHRDAHEAFNRRDWDGAVRDFAPAVEYIDHPRGTTAKGPGQFVDYLRSGWTTAFSDSAVINARYSETADSSIAQFDGTGTNDGPLGPIPPTGRSLNMPMCEVLTYDADGRVIRGELY